MPRIPLGAVGLGRMRRDLRLRDVPDPLLEGLQLVGQVEQRRYSRPRLDGCGGSHHALS